jgi:multiple sugar transport system substrate-binding protein
MTLGGGLLAACAGTGSGPAATTSSSLPTLQHWYHQYGETGTHEAVLKYAKDYTKANVKVSWVPGTGNEYPNKVNAALLGSNPPDVFETNGPTVNQIKAGLFEPLDDIIAEAKSDFSPAALKPLTIGGKIYAIKMINDFTFVYYRKSLFQKAGITQPPQTIDELITVTKKLSNSSIKGLYVGSDAGAGALHQMAVWSSGGDMLSEDNTKVTFNTDRAAAALLKLHELNASGGLLADAPTYWWDPSAFTQGQAAMQWCGFWAMPGITKALGDDFGIFPFPALDAQGTAVTNFGGWSESVAAKSKNVDAAKEYVKWLWISNSQAQIDWSVAYGFHVPPRISVAAQADKLKTGTAKEAVDLLNKYGKANSAYWTTAMDNILTDAAATIIKSGGNALSILNDAAGKANTELQKEQ